MSQRVIKFVLIVISTIFTHSAYATIKISSHVNNFTLINVETMDSYVSTKSILTILPKSVSGIRAPVGGEVTYIADVGQRLSKGSPLLEISTAYLQQRIEKLGRSVEITNQRINDKKSQIERRKKLVSKGIVTEESFNTLKTELRVLQEESKSIMNEITLLNFDIQNSRVLAETEGIITSKRISKGEFIQKNELVLSYTSTNTKEVHVKLPLEYYSLFELERDYSAVIDGNEYELKLLKKSPLDNGIDQFFLAIFDSNHKLIDKFAIGQRVIGLIKANTSNKIFRFNAKALKVGFEGPHIYELKDGKARKHYLKNYWHDAGYIITDDSLLAGKVLIVSNQKLIDGQEISTSVTK